MLFEIWAIFLQKILDFADASGRRSYFLREMPEAGEVITDIHYGSDPRQKLDLHLPKTISDKPCIIYIHGGGWLTGNKASFSRICAVWAAAGFPAANLNYRLAPQVEGLAIVSDIDAAVKKAVSLFEEHGCNAKKLVLAGDSAGAHLSAWYAAAAKQPDLAAWAKLNPIPAAHIRALILIYGLYDLKTAKRSGFPFIKTYIRGFLGENPTAEKIHKLSPLHFVDADYPRSFVCALESDALVDESRVLIERLKTKSAAHEVLIFGKKEYPLARHGLITSYTLAFAQKAMLAFLDFLDTVSNTE